LATARRARRDDLHRAVDAGDPVEVRPIVIVDVGVADEEVTDHDRGPDHLREVRWLRTRPICSTRQPTSKGSPWNGVAQVLEAQ
jgi:hypothetical protein